MSSSPSPAPTAVAADRPGGAGAPPEPPEPPDVESDPQAATSSATPATAMPAYLTLAISYPSLRWIPAASPAGRCPGGRPLAEAHQLLAWPGQPDPVARTDVPGPRAAGVGQRGDHPDPRVQPDVQPGLGTGVHHLGDRAGGPDVPRSRLAEADLLRADDPGAVLAEQRLRGRAGQQRRGADEAGDERGGGPLVHLRGRADLLDPAAVEDRDPVAHGQRLALVVGHEQEGDPDLALDGLQLDLHLLA